MLVYNPLYTAAAIHIVIGVVIVRHCIVLLVPSKPFCVTPRGEKRKTSLSRKLKEKPRWGGCVYS